VSVITIFARNCGECPVKLDRSNGTHFCVLHKREITDLTICECKTTIVIYGKVSECDEVFPRLKDLP